METHTCLRKYLPVTAEAARDLIAPISRLGDLFRGSGNEFKLLARDHNVIAVVTTTDLTAVCAMAKSLSPRQLLFEQPRPQLYTVMAGSPLYSILMFPQKQLPVGILTLVICKNLSNLCPSRVETGSPPLVVGTLGRIAELLGFIPFSPSSCDRRQSDSSYYLQFRGGDFSCASQTVFEMARSLNISMDDLGSPFVK